MRPNYYKRGFTLVELIAVIGILVILSSVVVGVMTSTLRGSNKATITNAVSYNGDYALTTASSAIVNSNKINSLIDTSGTSRPLTYFGAPLALSLIEVEDFDKSRVIVECTADNRFIITRWQAVSTGPIPTPAVRDLINTSDVKIKASTCKINYIRNLSYDTPQVEIAFTIEQTGTPLYESQAQASFKTRVTLRNY